MKNCKTKIIDLLKKNKIFGLDVWVFAIILFVGIYHIWFMNQHIESTKKIYHPFMTPLFIMMLLGITLNYIGNKTPVLNKLGLGFLLCILVPSYLVHSGMISQDIADKFNRQFFNKPPADGSQGLGINFSQFFITTVIAGSILSVDRDLLKRSMFKFVPLTLISIFLSIISIGFLGFLFGYKCPEIFASKTKGSFWDAIFFVAVPLTNGGTNLGINGFANGLYQRYFQEDAALIRSAILSPLILARVLSILFAGILFALLDKTNFSGKGHLEKKNNQITTNNKVQKYVLDYQNIGIGLLIIFALYSVGSIIDYIVGQKFTFLKLDAMVYVIFFLLIIKIFNLMSDKNQNFVVQSGKFVIVNFTAPALAGVGLTTKFSTLIACVTDINILIMVISSLLLAILISFSLSKYFGFYPLETSLTAGICSHSIGGTGNVGVMAISHRMDLLPFAMIATRVVGPIIYVLASITFNIIYVS
ncbi:MAG: 2-hydroxycarboxylate transporter family protein [Vigna little leaf phytoplasma]|nr:2-hydroxycarboxylate transporter family protein [Vigna little leaf phytoplasma]